MRKKGGVFKKITSVLVALLMVLSTIAISPIKANAATPKGYITVSVERFTLGLGYLIEPVKVPFYSGDNGAKILTRLLDDYGLEYRNTGKVDDTSGLVGSTFYLSYIRDDESKKAQIPKYITDQIKKEKGDLYGRQDSDWLGEFDYTYMSGWMYSVNNVFPGYGAAQYKPKDGDVMRWQYTVWGYGTDLGAVSEWSGDGFCKVANKTKLTKEIAEVNSASNSGKLLANKDIKSAYDNAYKVMKDMTISKSKVDSATKKLSTAVSNFNKPTPIPGKVEAVNGFKVVSTTTSSVKLAWNKVSDCTGYKIYRYDTSSKKYKLIKTISNKNTLTYTDSKKSSSNTYSYKIRAYKSGSKTQYSAYSDILKATTKPLTPKVTVKSTKTKKATISWKNTSSRNSGYEVYMATSKNGDYSLVKTTTAKTYTKTGLTKGKTYYFKVRAYKTVDGTKVYGNYSTVKYVKVK